MMANDQSRSEVGQTVKTYANVVKSKQQVENVALRKLISYLHGEPIIMWNQKEMDNMIIRETYNMLLWVNSLIIGLIFTSYRDLSRNNAN